MLVCQSGDGHRARSLFEGQALLIPCCLTVASPRRPRELLWGHASAMGTMGEILVVDDDARMRALVTKVLAREGYAVRGLPWAQEVLQALEEEHAELAHVHPFAW